MADDNATTIKAVFETCAAAEIAVEHLLQHQGIARADIFIQPVSEKNTVGITASVGDVSQSGVRSDAPLEGEIEVSADISASQIPAVQRVLGEAGANRVSGR